MGLTRVKVFDLEISKLFNASRPVGRYAAQINREIIVAADAEAPVGNRVREPHVTIRGSHVNNGTPKVGPYRISGKVSNRAPHAAYVYYGTNGPIFSHTKTTLKLPPFGKYGIYQKEVRGQRANPWLERAARTVLSRHRLI